MAIREGLWDCQACGTTGIRGRDRVCPNCGEVRPEAVTFYLPNGAAEVRDEQQLKRARGGADWICDFCAGTNQADKENCKQCGAPRDSSRAQQTHQYETADVPRTGDNAPHQHQPPPAAMAVSAAPRSAGARRKVAAGCLAAFAVGLLICSGLFWFSFLRKTQATMTVTGVSWSREVDIEQLRPVTKEDWSIPAGGRKISERRAVHHHDKVIDRYETKTRQKKVQVGTEKYVAGKKDLGNGYFEDIIKERPVYETRTETYQDPVYRRVPVYKTKYTYEIDQWVKARTARAGGTDRNPRWPEIKLAANEREADRRETYAVHLKDRSGKVHDFETNRQTWASCLVGHPYAVTLSGRGKVLEVSAIELERND